MLMMKMISSCIFDRDCDRDYEIDASLGAWSDDQCFVKLHLLSRMIKSNIGKH